MKLNKSVIAVILCAVFAGLCQIKTFASSNFQEEINLDNIITEIKNYQYRETKYQVELLEILDQAKKEMVPVTPLINKIKEGLSKDIGLKNIIDVVNKNKETLKLSRALLNEFENRGLKKGKEEDAEETAVISLAEFLMRGLTEEGARKIAGQVISQKGDYPRFLLLGGIFADLKEKELREDIIWTMVNVILEQNLREIDTKNLMNNIYRKIDLGEDIERYVRQLEKDKPTRALIRK
ncbi:MAG: hypothetical protein AB1498_12430 [bacterium]